MLGVASRDRLLAALVQGLGPTPVAQFTEPVEFVPEMIRADRLLTAFRNFRAASAAVCDRPPRPRRRRPCRALRRERLLQQWLRLGVPLLARHTPRKRHLRGA